MGVLKEFWAGRRRCRRGRNYTYTCGAYRFGFDFQGTAYQSGEKHLI